MASVPGDLLLNAYVLGLDGSRQRLGRQTSGSRPDWDKFEGVHYKAPTTSLKKYQAISTSAHWRASIRQLPGRRSKMTRIEMRNSEESQFRAGHAPFKPSISVWCTYRPLPPNASFFQGHLDHSILNKTESLAPLRSNPLLSGCCCCCCCCTFTSLPAKFAVPFFYPVALLNH